MSARQKKAVTGLFTRFVPPGPVAAGWLQSDAPMSFIMGPVGSAKTTTGAMKCLEVARRQHPSTVDGVRKAKILAARMNYRNMHRGFIPSWMEVFPPNLPGSVWKFEKDGPVEHILNLSDPLYGPIQLHMMFASVGDHDLEHFIRGFQPTSWWLNEVDEFPPGCLGLFFQRAGRAYMSELPKGLPPVKYCKVFGDLNAPDEDNWFNTDYIQNTPEGCELYIQPSGFSPSAENLEVLHRRDPEYYQTLAKVMRSDKGDWAVRRYIENKTGYSRNGEPVYEDFGTAHIAASDIEPQRGGRIIIGVDNGLAPAAVFTQSAGERFLIIDELVIEQGKVVSAREFGAMCGRKMLNEFRDFIRPGHFEIAFDPACGQRDSELRTFAINFAQGFSSVVGSAPVVKAISNDLQVRIGAVKAICQQFARGEPALRVNKRAKMILRGFMGGYQMVRVRGKNGMFQDRPDKGPYSHPHDALQYAAQRHRPFGANTAMAGSMARQGVQLERRMHDLRGGPSTSRPVIFTDADVSRSA